MAAAWARVVVLVGEQDDRALQAALPCAPATSHVTISVSRSRGIAPMSAVATGGTVLPVPLAERCLAGLAATRLGRCAGLDRAAQAAARPTARCGPRPRPPRRARPRITGRNGRLPGAERGYDAGRRCRAGKPPGARPRRSWPSPRRRHRRWPRRSATAPDPASRADLHQFGHGAGFQRRSTSDMTARRRRRPAAAIAAISSRACCG